jgi:hypothetical protein
MIALHTYHYSFSLWGFLAVATVVSALPSIIKAYKGTEKEDKVDSKK